MLFILSVPNDIFLEVQDGVDAFKIFEHLKKCMIRQRTLSFSLK
jgi:hypothetical protein